MPVRTAVATVLLLLLLASPASAGRFIWTPDALRADLSLRLTAEELAEISVPYEIDDEIRAWGQAVVAGISNSDEQAEAIARAIIAEEKLRTRYDAAVTLTAKEVFRTGRANCISLTNLYIGIARSVGLQAYYVDVHQAATVRHVGDVMLANGHICAGVRLPNGFRLYDFAQEPEKPYRRYSILDDREALATFLLARHINGVLDTSARKDVATALERSRHDADLALRVKPDFAKAWINLGSAYLRAGRRDAAIEMYQKALEMDGKLVAASLAMGYVYAGNGEWLAARDAFEHARSLLPGDARVRFHVGLAAYHQGDFAAARRSFEAALDLDPELREAWSGLGVTYRALGLEKQARQAFLTAGTPADALGSAVSDVEPASSSAPVAR